MENGHKQSVLYFEWENTIKRVMDNISQTLRQYLICKLYALMQIYWPCQGWIVCAALLRTHSEVTTHFSEVITHFTEVTALFLNIAFAYGSLNSVLRCKNLFKLPKKPIVFLRLLLKVPWLAWAELAVLCIRTHSKITAHFPKSSLTLPKSPLTFPKSSPTLPKSPLTFRVSHSLKRGDTGFLFKIAPRSKAPIYIKLFFWEVVLIFRKKRLRKLKISFFHTFNV